MARKWSSRDALGRLPWLGMASLYIPLLLSVAMTVATAQEEGGNTEKPSSYSKLAVIEYQAPNLYPESFDWDAKHKRFVVGSLSQGKLVTVTEQGVVEDFVKEDEAYAGANIMGVTVDPIRNRVLAVVHRLTGEPSLNALVAYDLDTKQRLLYSVLPIGGESNEKEKDKKKFRANDAAVDAEGNAYVTNSAGNSIWKVTAGGVSTVLVDTLPQLPLKSEMEEAKDSYANGIVVHPHGYLLVSQSNSGALLMIDLDDLQVHVVKISDDNSGGGVVMPGADGLALRPDDSLVVVSVHTAWLVSSRDSWRSARVIDKVPLPTEDFTTSAAVNEEGRVFTLQFHGFEFSKGVTRDSFTIMEIAFPADPDNNPLWLLMIPVLFGVLILAWKCQLNNFNKNYTRKNM